MPKRSILFVVRGGPTVPSCRFRAYQYENSLREQGVSVRYFIIEKSKNPWKQFVFHIRLFWISKQYSVVIYQKLLEPFRLWLVSLANKNLYFDFDDAMYVEKGEELFRKTIKTTPKVIAGNRILSDRALKYNKNVTIIPTTVPKGLPIVQDGTEKMVISWIGTANNLKYLEPVFSALSSIYQSDSDFELEVLTDKPEDVIKHSWITTKKWSYEEETNHFKKTAIGLMPLFDDEWARGKCGCKALQYLSYNKPVISSPVGVNKSILEEESRGVLVLEENWESAIRKTMQLVRNGFYQNTDRYEYVLQNYDCELWARKMVQELLPQ